MAIPEWAKRLKGEHQAIKEIKGKYYLYRIRYVYDPTKKRTVTKTDAYLGRLDEKKGLIPADIRIDPLTDGKMPRRNLEYGACQMLEALGADIRKGLREQFGEQDGDCIMAIAKLGLSDQQPEKRIGGAYKASYECVIHPDLPLSSSSISVFSARIGADRKGQLEFMRKFVDGTTHIIFDGTRLISYSNGIDEAEVGYNHSGIFDPQINLMYAFSLRPTKMPVYFRAFPGNTTDISNLSTCLQEMNLKDVWLIADRGFGSKDNLEKMAKSGIKYLVPLKRNSSEVEYSFMDGNAGTIIPFGDSVFEYHGRAIYYHVTQKYDRVEEVERWGKKGRPPKDWRPERKVLKRKDKIVVFMDMELKAAEEQTYALKMARNVANKASGKKIEKNDENPRLFGTIAIATDSDLDPVEMYIRYKERELIEDGNKAYKHVLGKFASYMQSTDTYNGWLFFNHVSLMLYYLVLGRLKEAGLNQRYSVMDAIVGARRIRIFYADEESCIITKPTEKELVPYDAIMKNRHT